MVWWGEARCSVLLKPGDRLRPGYLRYGLASLADKVVVLLGPTGAVRHLGAEADLVQDAGDGQRMQRPVHRRQSRPASVTGQLQEDLLRRRRPLADCYNLHDLVGVPPRRS